LHNKKNKQNGNGNGNGRIYKIGTCPYCGKSNIQLTEHHLYKKAVFGYNDIVIIACRKCHDVIEYLITTMEGMILRSFVSCYRDVNKGFRKGEINGLEIDLEKKMNEEEVIDAMMPLVIKAFDKIQSRGFNPWLVKRIKTKGVTIRLNNNKKGR
jgi:transcription elongation factor Elf1